MKVTLIRLGILLGSLLVQNAATHIVLRVNARNGVYAPDADTLAIPIFLTAMWSLIMLVYSVLASGIVHLLVGRASQSPRWRFMLLATVTVAFYIPPLLVPIVFLLYWFGPNHYLLSVAVVLPGIVVAWMLASELRQLSYNYRFKPTSRPPLRSGAAAA